MKSDIGLYIFLSSIVVVVVILMVSSDKPTPFESEINCNTGFVGIDFKSKWDNQPYKDNITINQFCNSETGCVNEERTITKYHQEWLPERFDLENIKGLNCKMVMKGSINTKWYIQFLERLSQ